MESGGPTNLTRCFGSAAGSNFTSRKSPPCSFLGFGSCGVGGWRFEITLTIASAFKPLSVAVITASAPTWRPSNSIFASPMPVKSSRASILTWGVSTVTSGLFDSMVTKLPASTFSGMFARKIITAGFPVWM